MKNDPQVITFGCRLNTYESEVIRQHAQTAKLKDTLIFNTCSVTNEAERQGRQAIRKARRQYPTHRIVVTGCSAQTNPQQYLDMAEVDQILGNQEKMQANSYRLNHPKALVGDIMTVRETAYHLISGFENRARAFVEIQNGCNHRCTFCSIPYGRGNNRGVPVGEIVRQIQQLVESGSKEIVLTGVDITDYGQDLPGTPNLGQLVRRILNQVPGLPRLRLSSLDPVEVDEDLFALIANNHRLMPHFHISLQAGDDMILKRMKRRHLRHHIFDFVERVRSLRPGAVFGADIIAGFPTETEEMHVNSRRLVEECDLTYLHVFPYSQRNGTPAARMPQVARPVVKERAAALRAAGQKNLTAYLKKQVGKTVTVLMETDTLGRTDHYAQVLLATPPTPAVRGTFVRAALTGVHGDKLLGTLLKEASLNG